MTDALTRIQHHLSKLSDPHTMRRFRPCHWYEIIRLAQKEYDREFVELSAINAMKAGPQAEVPVV